jgi:hydrogenase expression/formation protein HypD
MKFVDEFRDPAAARALVKSITELAGDGEFKFMEVCGGHTHTIYRHGIEHLLPEAVELVHGPGCPVCVIPMGRVDDAMWLAEQPGVIFTTFGDMMRVPRPGPGIRQRTSCQASQAISDELNASISLM